jgi:hypothetical protein
MLLTIRNSILIICSIVFVAATVGPALSDDSDSGQSDPVSETKVTRKHKIVEWFKKYDQIRREAEMSLADKFQALLMATGDPGKRAFNLASRMSTKYKRALAEIKKLKPEPETKDLQEGYTEYFVKARQVLEEHLAPDSPTRISNKSLEEVRKNLEELDHKNKQLDDDLRKEFHIPKHRHS